jgi:hypothetical protein
MPYGGPVTEGPEVVGAPAGRRRRAAPWIALASVPALALLCCVPGFAALGGMDANCGDSADGFDHECLDLSQPVFTIWPWVTGAVAVAALAGTRWIPHRSTGARLALAGLIVVPPVLNAIVAFVAVVKTGML